MSKFQIIILYASLDDKPANNEETGWISSFAENLSQLLRRLDNNAYNVLKLTEYDVDPESYPSEKSVILPVLSTNFFQSPLLSGYLDVLETEIAKRSKKKSVRNYLFLSVYKNRVGIESLPDYIIRSKKKNFYTVDSLTDFVTEIQFANDSVKDHYYWMKIFDLAYQIRGFFGNPDNTLVAAEELVDNMRPDGIYLAQVGLDLELDRENIYRELIRNGFKVYQLEFLDRPFEELTESINGMLSKCFLSIHLIGEDAGTLIKDRGLSIVEIENQLSSEHGKQVNQNVRIRHHERFKRIVWLSPERQNLSVKQKMFVENLKKDLVNIQNAEILELPIEELKNFVNNFIDFRFQTFKTGSLFDQDAKKRIYFICDKNEFKQCKPIGKLLEDKGYEVVFSNFEGEVMQIRDRHAQYLQECDGTLIYYGNNNENWVKSKIFDSVKSLGLGRVKGSNPTAIIVDSEKKVDLDLFFDTDKLILSKNDVKVIDAFEPFLSRIEEN